MEEYISLLDGQVIARKIYFELQERRKAARLAEVEYWKFLDDDDLILDLKENQYNPIKET